MARSPRHSPSAATRSGHASSVGALATALEMVAPRRLAESWDNVGLLLGDRQAPCARVLLTIDYTAAVLEEALDLGVDAVIAYHPPIFEALKRLVSDDPKQRLLLETAQAGIALLSPHTALDAVQGGVNDWLAEGIAGGAAAVARAGDYQPLRTAESLPRSEAYKIVVFAPGSDSPQIRDALAQAGAGQIGLYDRCSTRVEVTGAFRGLEGASPAIGTKGRVEEVREERIEAVCSRERLPWALAALRAVHSYDAPAYEVHALAARPSLDEGAGRFIELRTAATAREIAARLRKHLGTKRIELAAAPGVIERHTRIGLCAGAGASLLPEAIARGATLFVTGEARHHDQLAATAAGCSLLLAGHTVTERGYLPRLAERIAPIVPGVAFTTAKTDAHPLVEA